MRDPNRNYREVWKTFTGVATLALKMPKLILIETINFNSNFLSDFVWYMPLKKVLINIGPYLIT